MIWILILGGCFAAYLLRSALRPPRLISLPELDDRLEPISILPRGAVPPEIVRLGGAVVRR